MSDILDFYQRESKKAFQAPWLMKRQKDALSEFCRYGFPTRQIEDWKYTAMDSFLQQRFESGASTPDDGGTVTAQDSLPKGRHIHLSNGIVSMQKDVNLNLPAGVIILSLENTFNTYPDKIEAFLGKALTHEHGFHALNLALLQSGVFIYIPKGIKLLEPIVLVHWQDNANQAVHLRHLIVAEEGAQATVIEVYQGAEGCSYFTNAVTEVHLANHALLTHYTIQSESKESFHISHVAVKQQASSQFDSHVLSLGGKLARRDMTLYLQEPKSSCLLNGIYMPIDNGHIDHHTTVHHLVADCQSSQDYKGILNGQSRAVFNGKVIVYKGADKTQARQQNKNVLLSTKAEVDTKPQLDIFADDVICSHGATVGQLDEDALFYMMARGIDREEAVNYLIHAFAADNLRLALHAEMAAWMAHLINLQLR